MTKKVAIMKGDGIGPEIVDAMTGILKECNLQSEMVFCDAGSEQWEKNGSKDASYIPESTMNTLEEVDNNTPSVEKQALIFLDLEVIISTKGGISHEKVVDIVLRNI